MRLSYEQAVQAMQLRRQRIAARNMRNKWLASLSPAQRLQVISEEAADG